MQGNVLSVRSAPSARSSAVGIHRSRLPHPGPSRDALARAAVSPSADTSASAQRRIRVAAPNENTGGTLEVEVQARPNTKVFTVSLKKPLGLVLTERSGRIEVESLAAGGHAAAAGVAEGDALLAVTARPQAGAGRDALRDPLVLMPAGGQSFATVSAAIRSNTCAQCYVHLVFERAAGAAAAGSA